MKAYRDEVGKIVLDMEGSESMYVLDDESAAKFNGQIWKLLHDAGYYGERSKKNKDASAGRKRRKEELRRVKIVEQLGGYGPLKYQELRNLMRSRMYFNNPMVTRTIEQYMKNGWLKKGGQEGNKYEGYYELVLDGELEKVKFLPVIPIKMEDGKQRVVVPDTDLLVKIFTIPQMKYRDLVAAIRDVAGWGERKAKKQVKELKDAGKIEAVGVRGSKWLVYQIKSVELTQVPLPEI